MDVLQTSECRGQDTVGNRSLKFRERLRMDTHIGQSSTYMIAKGQQEQELPREKLRKRSGSRADLWMF